MNTYQLIATDGQSYGPVDENGLAQWARERRILPVSQIRCVETGAVTPAESLPFLASAFGPPSGGTMVAYPGAVPPARFAPGGILSAEGHTLSAMPGVVVILLHYFTCGIFPLIWFGLMHGRLPQTRPDDPSAGKAIGFMFIPFFNLYWLFFSYIRLCDRIDEARIRAGLPSNNQRGLAITKGILTVIPYVNLLGFLIMDPIFYGMLQGQVNELVEKKPAGV
jgi:hypothetical protein